ncbi:MAG: hypothetical protein DRJ15_06640 [Bacteroidetes bacterium]|nr:MAG: hypothetical protein DRJ15_06640 [Bacteroidota bacterium]
MCKLLLFVPIVFLCSIAANCQDATFEYLLSTPMNEVVYDVFESESGDIIFCGFVSKPNEFMGKTEGLIVKIDNKGNFKDSIILISPNRRNVINRLLSDSNNSIVTSGYTSDTTREFIGYKNSIIEIKKISSQLDILDRNSFSLPTNYEYWFSITERGANNNLLVGGTIKTLNFQIFFYVLSNNFDSIQARYYSDEGRVCGAIKQLSDTTYWMADEIMSDYYSINEHFDLIVHENARPNNINSPYGIKWDTDTSFYLTGEWNGGSDHDIGLYKQKHPIDSTNSLFKSWGTSCLDIPASGALDFNHKDSIFIGGTKCYGIFFGTWPSWYYVLQTDSNLNIRWERFYGGDAYYKMQKIIAAKDGGCIIAGTRYDYQNVTEEELDIHVLKLNSEGLLVSTPEEPAIEMREALVFPNPGTNHLKVRIAAHYKKSNFELYDISGKIVLSEQIIGKWGEVNTVAFKSGTYVYRIYNEEGLFESGKWLKR